MYFILIRIISISLCLLALTTSTAKNQSLSVTPNIYESPRTAKDCHVGSLAKAIVKSCNRRYDYSQNSIQWQAKRFSQMVCQGIIPLLGQRITYPVYGDVAACKGAAPTPRFESWICDVEISESYVVRAPNVYYSTCQG